MGKTARPYPTGHFRLNPKKNATVDTPLVIQLEYVVKGKPIRRSTGYTASISQWDKKNNKGRGGVNASYGADHRNLNNRLTKLVNDTDARLELYCEKNPDKLTWDIAVAVIDKAPEARDDKGIDFAEYVKDLLQSEKERNKIGQSVYKNGLSGMNIFGEFLITEKLGTYKPDGIYISEISVSLVEKYIAWRRTVKKNSDATINHALTPILKACHKAALEGYITTLLDNSIQGMRIIASKSLQSDDDSQVRHMSEEEIKALIDFYNNDREPRRKEYVEMFLFAMYACGMRFVDVLTLQWNNIDMEKRIINKIQVKTKNRNIVPLSDKAVEILKRWKGKKGCSRFVFGMIPDDFNLDDKEALYKIRTTKTRSVNQSLEVVGENMVMGKDAKGNVIRLKYTLSFHVARHTFAVQALNQGMSMSVVSQLLGHGSSEITERVYAHYVPATLTSELEKIKLPSL